MASLTYDVVVVGASLGGVAAALAAASDPKVRVALLEPSQWVGGQATSQGVTRWDESGMPLIETCGSAKSYRDLRTAIRSWYRNNVALSAYGAAQQYFNPGFAQPGYPFTADPHIAQQVLRGLLSALGSRLDLRLGTTVTAVSVQGSAIANITARSSSGADTYVANVYIDATDLGDLLPLAGLPWKIGAESSADTGEADAPSVAHPEWVQPITVPVALERRPDGENHRITKPANYDDIVRAQGFKVTDGDITGVFTVEPGGSETLWGYRRYIDARNFADSSYATDRSTLNVGSNDYQAATIPTGDPERDATIVQAARAVSLAYVYWLQTDVPHDGDTGGTGATGYPNLMLRTDAFGTADGTAPAAYIRESRRIDALTRVVQEDIAQDSFPAGTMRAKAFADACGIGWYGIDVHPASGPGTPQVGFSTLHFQVPLGALLPKTLTNFVAGCKNIGTTHLTSGAYRVHPVEWAIGEAAGVLAAFCTTQNVGPHDVYNQPDRCWSYQYRLAARGTPITWWDDVTFESDARAFIAIQLTAVRGIFAGVGGLSFDPQGAFSNDDRQAIDERVGRSLPWPAGTMNRAETAIFVCDQLGLPV
jgi:hypothetical protein